MKKLPAIMVILIVPFMNSCQKDEVKSEKSKNLNAFGMTLNDSKWTPSTIDECTKTFNCNVTFVNDDDAVYKIEAFKNPANVPYESENFFEINIMNANDIGIYFINGDHEVFQSYCRLTINDEQGRRRYQNKKGGNSFRVTVAEMFTREGTDLKGIGGSFSGYLYNLENASDSVNIENGRFTFKKINWYNFNQCED